MIPIHLAVLVLITCLYTSLYLDCLSLLISSLYHPYVTLISPLHHILILPNFTVRRSLVLGLSQRF
jgi:hypothetical protein